MTLWRAGYVELEPRPPLEGEEETAAPKFVEPSKDALVLSFKTEPAAAPAPPQRPQYKAQYARPTPELQKLMLLRSVNPLYGVFLVNQLGIASREERIQALESVLELPGSIAHFVRVPRQDELPPGPLATTRLDSLLLQLGLATAEELVARSREEEEERRFQFPEERVWVLTLADKLRRLFDYEFPHVYDLYTNSVWAAGELLEFGGDFNKYVTSKSLQKQEGLIFRHLLRLILLTREFAQLTPPDASPEDSRGELDDIALRLTETCRQVDPTSTERTLEQVAVAADLSTEDE